MPRKFRITGQSGSDLAKADSFGTLAACFEDSIDSKAKFRARATQSVAFRIH